MTHHSSCTLGHQWRGIFALALLVASGFVYVPSAAAEISLLAPGRLVDPDKPLRLTLIATGEANGKNFQLPQVLEVLLRPELGAVLRVELRPETPLEATFTLRPGEFRRIDYVGTLPKDLRGTVRLDAVGVDAPPMLVRMTQPKEDAIASNTPLAPAADTAGSAPVVGKAFTAAATTPAAAETVTVRAPPEGSLDAATWNRLRFYDPMFFVAGPNTDANAQMQLSFKLLIYEGTQRSRALRDNFYFGYTQTSFWDLTSESKPFLDTSYRPSFFYALGDTGWNVGGHPVGVETGYEHESNGKDGDASRSIDTLYVKPIFMWGDTRDFYATFAPKLYVYLDKSENDDIQKYRGYGDFRFTYGNDSSWQLAATLRKGTSSEAYNVDAQWTYPLNSFFPGLAGYFMLQLSNGWGETLLNYNVRESTAVRAGYAISR